MTLKDTPNAISSQGLGDGQLPLKMPDGQTAALFGQAPAPASLSAPPVRARRPMTSATFGLSGFLSSPSATLQSSLESRLRQRLDTVGSTLFSLTWKARATPAGRPYCQLAASALRISDSARDSWPTPNAGPLNDGDTTWQERRAALKEKHGNGNGFGLTLGQAVSLASWPTPCTQDGPKGGPNQGIDRLPGAASLASWATPTSRDHKDGSSEGTVPINGLLCRQAWLAAWSTPRANKRGFPDAHGSHEAPLGPQSTGSPAQTEKRGQLNPAHSRWLMG